MPRTPPLVAKARRLVMARFLTAGIALEDVGLALGLGLRQSRKIKTQLVSEGYTFPAKPSRGKADATFLRNLAISTLQSLDGFSPSDLRDAFGLDTQGWVAHLAWKLQWTLAFDVLGPALRGYEGPVLRRSDAVAQGLRPKKYFLKPVTA